MYKDKKKKIEKALVRYAYYLFTWLFAVLPYRVIKAMTGVLLVLVYSILKRMRRTAMDTLNIAFGQEKSQQELQLICKECFYNAGRGVVEIGAFSARPQLIKEAFSFEGDSKKNLDEALKLGKGVIGISAHFGNFPLMLLHLAQIGYPTNAIIRPSRDEYIEKDFQVARSRLGLKTVHSYPRETCVAQSLKTLRDKELLIVLLDQNTGSKSGVYVDFFGQKAGTPTGPIIFAMRTGSPLLPMFALRKGNSDKHLLIVEKYFYIEKKATDEETIQFNVQKLTNIIEAYIRKYPTEWGWMHRRWKSRPKGEVIQGSVSNELA